MIAVVIPCYRERKHILDVLAGIGAECGLIYVVDDACPERTGDWVERHCADPRVRVLHHTTNQGVGGATLTGLRAALAAGATVVVRLDGDGQMRPELIPSLIEPIVSGEADYAKGNRFFEPAGLASMPRLRLAGNAVLSFASKLSSGYWNIFDPHNGFTAIHGAVARQLPLERLSRGWFFESDMLFYLGCLRAVVVDVPMPASYEDEQSSLAVSRVIAPFALKHVINTLRRIFYNYYLRNFNIASIELALGIPLILFGSWVGVTRWIGGSLSNTPSTSGTVMLAALPVIIGMQLILGFLNFDLQNVPSAVLHRRMAPPLPRPPARNSGA